MKNLVVYEETSIRPFSFYKISFILNNKQKCKNRLFIAVITPGVDITFEKPDRIELDRIEDLKNLIGSDRKKVDPIRLCRPLLQSEQVNEKPAESELLTKKCTHLHGH